MSERGGKVNGCGFGIMAMVCGLVFIVVFAVVGVGLLWLLGKCFK